jgi:hypothetical protein
MLSSKTNATLDQPGTAMQTRDRPGARGVHGVDSGWSGVCAWFCVILSVLPVSDSVCAVQCQHGTSGDCVQQQKGCTNRLQIRFARFGRHLGSARHGNADSPAAGARGVHGVDSGWSGVWSGVCSWFCVILSVLPVSDWVCASSVSMAPLVIVCSCRRGAPTVFKSVLPVLDATLDQPGTAMQTRHRPGARGVHGVDSGWSGVCAWFYVILSYEVTKKASTFGR